MATISLPDLRTARVVGKRVFVRCDFDVPLSEKSTIADDTRLISAVSTIEYLLENGATVIAAGHLGRPREQFAIDNLQLIGRKQEFSLEPVVRWFTEEFPGTSLNKTQIGGFPAWRLKENFYILENLRLSKGEETNDPALSHKLAYVSDIYVNEAFGASHRPHASIVGIPALLPHFSGFHFFKEVKVLADIIENPRHPFTFIIGGAKIETKLPLISKMHKFADYVLIGGQLAEQIKVLEKEQHGDSLANKAILLVADCTQDKKDITEMSLDNFQQIILRSKCVIWNGPMGLIEEGFDETTKKLAKAIIESSSYKVVGGGDTIGFLHKEGILNKFDFVSVGGGAMLEFLSGESLPGILALQK